MGEALSPFTQTNANKDQKTQKEINLEKALEELWSEDKMVFKADLAKSSKLWLKLARLYTVAVHYDLSVAQSLHKHILNHSVSIDRQGRKEFINMFQVLNDEREEDKEATMMKKFFG